MEPHEYRTLFEIESSYWWFRALRAILLDVCRRLGLGAGSRILDAGCGTGKTTQVLHREVSEVTFGFDISPMAAQYWSERGLSRRLAVGSVNAIPFRDGSFDATIAVDVLECEEVDEALAYRELLRVLRPGGFLVAVVPAYGALFSPEHHRAVGANRRYSRREFRALLASRPGRVVRLTHLFATLFGPIVAYRLWKRLEAPWRDRLPRSELRPLPRLLNEALFRAVDWERGWLARADLPVGSSMLAVVQKP